MGQPLLLLLVTLVVEAAGTRMTRRVAVVAVVLYNRERGAEECSTVFSHEVRRLTRPRRRRLNRPRLADRRGPGGRGEIEATGELSLLLLLLLMALVLVAVSVG